MQRHFKSILYSLALSLLATSAMAATGTADSVGPQDAKAVVGLIKYLYAGYGNGANERKSFFETVPWDIETGRLADRVQQCGRRKGEAIVDFDWPSASQDPQINNLSVVYSGSPSPRHATVRASFNGQVVIFYDMYLYDDAPQLRRWGVSNIRIHDVPGIGNQDLLATLRHALSNECKGF